MRDKARFRIASFSFRFWCPVMHRTFARRWLLPLHTFAFRRVLSATATMRAINDRMYARIAR